MNKVININGVDCRFEDEESEHGFVNVEIVGEPIPKGLSKREIKWLGHTGQILWREWIVRNATDEQQALAMAEIFILARRRGYKLLQHDDEGVVRLFKMTMTREEFERMCDGEKIHCEGHQLTLEQFARMIRKEDREEFELFFPPGEGNMTLEEWEAELAKAERNKKRGRKSS
jgi:hypothetical protein